MMDLDVALENLGFSYLDDVPFSVDPRLAAARIDLGPAEALLARPPPSMTGLHNIDLSEMGRMEKQFLKHLDQIDEENKARKEVEDKEISDYEEKKNREAEDKRMTEEERIKEEEEKKMKAETETSEKETEEKKEEEIVANKEKTDSILLPNSSQSEGQVKSDKLEPLSNINYSDFEAESDPFERAELQTLDDLGILATVLQTSAPKSQGATVGPTFINSVSTSTTTTPSSQQPPQQQHGMFYQGQPHFYPSHYGQMPQFPQVHYSVRPVPNPVQIISPPWGATATPLAFPQQPMMKSSKSFGDIQSEIKKEASGQATNPYFGKNPELRKLSSQTPPPRPIPSKHPEANKVFTMDNWIPWPDLDGADTFRRKGNSPAKSFDNSALLLEGLSPTSAATCRRIHDMGFPLARVTKVCRTLGDDEQQIINFCLIVDKFVESESFDAEPAEHALLLHSVSEEKARKHLEVFKRLAEFGFESEKIHFALIQNDLDYEKTVESLLK